MRPWRGSTVTTRPPSACRLWPRRELRRAPDRALVQAIPRLGNGKDRRHGAADGMAAGALAAAAAAADRAWRLSPRQHDRRARHLEDLGGARLGIVDARRPAGGFFVPSNAVAHAAVGGR